MARGFSAGKGQFGGRGVQESKLYSNFIKQPPPATVIRLGVAMVTGEVT